MSTLQESDPQMEGQNKDKKRISTKEKIEDTLKGGRKSCLKSWRHMYNVNATPTPNANYISYLCSEEPIDKLAQIPLNVISTTSTLSKILNSRGHIATKVHFKWAISQVITNNIILRQGWGNE